MQGNEKLSVAPNGNHASNGQSQPTSVMMSLGSVLNRKPNSMSSSAHSAGNDMFSLTLKGIKKEPGESLSCSKHLDCQIPSDNMFQGRFGDDFDEHMMDADLQELFNELTDMSVPPMSDLELQNMINITIKQDEPFNIDIGGQNQRGTPKSFPPMDKIVIKTEYSPGLNQAPVSSPQMRTSSSGPAFSLPNTAMSTSSPVISISQGQTHTQVSSCLNRGMPTWQEVSHAQQLKQIAANRQQHALIQQQQQQHNQQSNWSTLSSSGPSAGSFGQEKVPSPSLRQPQYNSQMPGVPANGNQSKGMNNYLYKPNSNPQNNHMDMLMQQKSQERNLNFINNTHSPVEQHHSSSKALFHFTPEQANQQMHSVLASQSKPSIGHYSQQQQTPAAVQQQQQDHQALQNQSLSRPPNGPMPLEQKLLLQKLQQVPGFQYSVLQHRQDQHSVVGSGTGPSPAPNACPNPNSGSGYLGSSQASILTQQQLEKKQALQRQMMEQKQQLLLQQQMLADVEKITPQDQLNRHLTRPPPDYKDQRRNTVNIQQAGQYSGASLSLNLNSNQPLSSPVSTSSILSQNSDLLSTSQAPRMPSLPAVRNMGMYGNPSCNQPSLYVKSGVNQLQQHSNQNQIGASQTNAMISRQSAIGQGNGLASFGTGYGVSPPQMKQALNQGAANMPRQRLENVVMNSNAAPQSWSSHEAAAKQDTLKASTIRFPTSTPYANQSLQSAVNNQHFPQRTMAPPNQIAPGVQMRTSNQMSPALNGPAMGSLRADMLRPTQLRPQPLSNINQSGPNVNPPSTVTSNTFTTTSQNSRAFPNNDPASDLGFDFLNQPNDSLGSALSSHSDFIDSLLKTGPGNDDWMKDINLDEILGNPS